MRYTYPPGAIVYADGSYQGDGSDALALAAHESALAGTCSHGGHGYDGETCSDISDALAAPAKRMVCGDCGVPVVPCAHSVNLSGQAWDHEAKQESGPCAGLLSSFAAVLR